MEIDTVTLCLNQLAVRSPNVSGRKLVDRGTTYYPNILVLLDSTTPSTQQEGIRECASLRSRVDDS